MKIRLPVLLTQRQLIRFLLLVLLVALLAEAAMAQNATRASGTAAARQPQALDPATVCSEPSDPRAVSADVNLCVDRLVKADVQDVPGARVDRSLFPDNDPELLSPPQGNLPAPRPKAPSLTSWGPSPSFTSWGLQPGLTLWGPRPANAGALPPEADKAVSEAPVSPAAPLPEAPLLTDTTIIPDEPSPDHDSSSVPRWKLKRAQAREEEERRRRLSRELQKRFDAQCRQLHLSDLQCRLKLNSDPLAAVTDRMNKLEKLPTQENHSSVSQK